MKLDPKFESTVREMMIAYRLPRWRAQLALDLWRKVPRN
jgi:hypothetical protein